MLNHNKSTALEWSVTDNMVGGTVQTVAKNNLVFTRIFNLMIGMTITYEICPVE